MIRRLIDSPIPVPCGFVVKKASKMRSAIVRQPDAGITYRNQQLTVVAHFRGDGQFTTRVSHRLDSVDHEIHQDLLQQYPIRCRRRKPRVYFRTDEMERRFAVSRNRTVISRTISFR